MNTDKSKRKKKPAGMLIDLPYGEFPFFDHEVAAATCDKCGKNRQHAGGGCIHCITQWCKDKVKEAQANAKPEVALVEAYRCGAESRDVEVAELVTALERIGKYPRVSGDELGYEGCRAVAREALAKVRKTNEP